MSRLGPGENRLTIHAYDRFFNRVTKTFLVRTKPQVGQVKKDDLVVDQVSEDVLSEVQG